MNEHKFSNQKSALEDYFESLLSDDETAQQNEVPANTAAVVADTTTAETAVAEVVAEPVTPAVDDNVIIEPAAIAENQQSIETPKRTSVEEMLATVEEKLHTQAEQLPEFAEPEPDIPIPMPEVAPPVAEVKTETVVETEVESTVEEVAEQAVEQEVATEVSTVEDTVREATTPDWADSPFQCLLFNVGGLALAVPLVRLNGVIPWSENVVETPNQTDWYLGVLMNHGHKVQVIDTAMMVLPEEHRVDMPADPEERLSHILLVDDQKWGLACDSIGDVVWLKKDEVKWRSNKTKRPWLLGTAINHMCAVMDTEAFADMLDESR